MKKEMIKCNCLLVSSGDHLCKHFLVRSESDTLSDSFWVQTSGSEILQSNLVRVNLISKGTHLALFEQTFPSA